MRAEEIRTLAECMISNQSDHAPGSGRLCLLAKKVEL